jgi:3-hydroxyacyl-[acyl-carrier-protein] dehydratase
VRGQTDIIDPSEIDLNNVIADIEEIRKYNPQRYDMEQLTAVVYEDAERGICAGYSDLTREEFWVQGHMPGMPLMPGVMMLEAAAQLSSYLVLKHDPRQTRMVALGGFDDVRFRDPVIPGDRLVMVTQRVKHSPNRMMICRFQGFVRNTLCVEGRIRGISMPDDFLDALMQQKI